MKKVISQNFLEAENTLDNFILNFDTEGTVYGNQNRNSLKLFEFGDLVVNVKSFKLPNIVNQVVYGFFRKSKAQRSFEHANKLLSLNIKKSYYVSEQLDCDETYRDLTHNFEIPDYENILRAFTRFTFKLHEENILFLDHSPGNTLIKKTDDGYNFFLVDLNRMTFKPLNLNERIKNFERLTIHESMVKIMSDEYAKCIHEDYNKVFNLMWNYTNTFQRKYRQRRRLKNKLRLWKK